MLLSKSSSVKSSTSLALESPASATRKISVSIALGVVSRSPRNRLANNTAKGVRWGWRKTSVFLSLWFAADRKKKTEEAGKILEEASAPLLITLWQPAIGRVDVSLTACEPIRVQHAGASSRGGQSEHDYFVSQSHHDESPLI